MWYSVDVLVRKPSQSTEEQAPEIGPTSPAGPPPTRGLPVAVSPGFHPSAIRPEFITNSLRLRNRLG